MKCKSDKDILNEILLTSNDIKKNRTEILELVPELIICVPCTQKHPAHIYNVYEHIEETVNKVEFDLTLKVTALFHDIGKPYKKVTVDGVERFWGHEGVSAVLTKFILQRLQYENGFIERVCKLIEYHDCKIKHTYEGISEIRLLVGEDLMPYLFKIKIADLLSHSPEYSEVKMPTLIAVKNTYEKIERMC